MEIENNDEHLAEKAELLRRSQNLDMFLSYMKRAMELEGLMPNDEMVKAFAHDNLDTIQNLYLQAIRLYEAGEDEKAQEHLRVYQRFSTLIGENYCQLPHNAKINAKMQEKANEQLAATANDQRLPMSDWEALFFGYHYSGATSNRTVGGAIAIKMISHYHKIHGHEENNPTIRLYRAFEAINGQASAREKVIRIKEGVIMMETARAAHSNLQKAKHIWSRLFHRGSYSEDLAREIRIPDANDETRQLQLAGYKLILERNIVKDSVDTLTDLLEQQLQLHIEEKGLANIKPEKFDVDTKELYDTVRGIQRDLVEIKLNDADEADIILGSKEIQLKNQ